MNFYRFFIALLCLGMSMLPIKQANAVTFYFSAAEGDDKRPFIVAKNSATPWKTLKKFNEIAANLAPGDTVSFKRGEKFFGQLLLRKSGTKQKPIVITSYGEGNEPEIHGWEQLETPENSGQQQYIYDLSGINFTSDQTVQTVSVGGVLMAKGRYPNDDFLRYQATENEKLILSKNTEPLSRYANAEIVLRKNEWIFDKGKILQVDQQGILFENQTSYKPTNDYGFFIQDHSATLDRHGEWFHDKIANKLIVFIDKNILPDPSVKISTVDHLVTNKTNVKFVTIQGLKFTGSRKSIIYLTEGAHISIIDCTIEAAGEDGIYITNVPYITISGSTINSTFGNGIFLRYGTPHAVLVNNAISNINLFAGMGNPGDQVGIGIYCRSDSSYIAGNTLKDIGYSGIFFGGNHTTVEKNLIDGFCLTKNDGGGIYTYEGKRNLNYTNRVVQSNTILNGKGTRKGNRYTNSIDHPQVEGIYIDDNASGIAIRENVVATVSRNGINLHNARQISVIQNTVIDCANLLSFSDDNLGDPIKGVLVQKNNLITTSSSQQAIKISGKSADLMGEITFSGNILNFPESSELMLQVNNGFVSLKDWPNYDPHYVAIPFTPIDIKRARSVATTSKGTNHVMQKKDISPLNKDCEIGAGTDGLFFTTREPLSGVKIAVGSIKDDHGYSLKIKGSAESEVLVRVYLRNAGSPWSSVSETQVFTLSPRIQEKTVTFLSTASSDNTVVMLKVEKPNGKIHINELAWIEEEANYSKPQVSFKLNTLNRLDQVYVGDHIFHLQ
nr:hypothetical protein [Cytophagales bacterium]